jgi:hypothetical protein
MKRVYAAMGAFLVLLMALGLFFVKSSQTAGVAGVLPRLRGGEADYQYVRSKVLFMMGDPAPAMYDFVTNPATNRNAQFNALRLLQELAGHQSLVDGGVHVAPLVADTSPAMRGQVLKTLHAMKSLAGIDPVVRLYHTTIDTAERQLAYDALKAATDPLNTALDRAMRESDSVALDSCIALVDAHPVGKGRLLSKLARHFHRQADYQRSAEFYRRMGVPDCWWAVGEFEFESAAAVKTETVFSPETRPFNPHDTFVVSEGFVSRWFPLQRNNDWGNLDLRPLFSRQDHTAAYFFTYLHVPSARDAYLFVHTDDGGPFWLNDSVVVMAPGYKEYVTNEDVARVRLRAGVNRLMAKVVNAGWGWTMFVRVADSTGEAMEDVSFSLSPDPRQYAMDTIVARAAEGDPAWRTRLDSVSVENNDAVKRVLDVIVDRGASAQRKRAALDVLIEMNARRRVPAGERELVALGMEMAKSGKGSPLLSAVAKALADMGTTRALDLGLAMRVISDPACRFEADRLISVHSRARIMGMGRLDDPAKLARNARAVDEITSLEPSSPWIRHRLAWFRFATGDSALGEQICRAYRMPRRWALRKTGCDAAQVASATCVSGESAAVDSTLAGIRQMELPPPWRIIPEDAFEPLGMHAELVADFRNRRTRTVYELRTAFTCDSACSAYVGFTLAAPSTVWLNGERVASVNPMNVSAYDNGIGYPWERLHYDVERYPVKLRAGRNAISIAYVNEWITNISLHRFRVALYDREGNAMPMDRNGSVSAAPR